MNHSPKLLAVLASLIVSFCINDVKASNNEESFYTWDTDSNTWISHDNFGDTNAFRYDEIANDSNFYDSYAIFRLQRALPITMTISNLISYMEIAINNLNSIFSDGELPDNTKRKLMKTIINIMETFLYPLSRIPNIDTPITSTTYLRDAVNALNLNNFATNLNEINQLLYNIPYSYYNYTVGQILMPSFYNAHS